MVAVLCYFVVVVILFVGVFMEEVILEETLKNTKH